MTMPKTIPKDVNLVKGGCYRIVSVSRDLAIKVLR